MIANLWIEFVKFRSVGDARAKLKPWRASTRKEYERFWECSFKYFWADKDENDIENHWDDFIAAERRRSKKGSRLRFIHHIKYLGTFVNWMFKLGIIKEKPSLYDPNWVSDEAEAEKLKHIFSDNEARLMMDHTAGAFGLYVRMGLLMGMRSSEITQLKKDRIEIVNGIIKLRAVDTKTGSKTGKGRTIAIHDKVMGFLKEQYSATDSEFLFPNRDNSSRPMSRLGFRPKWDKLMKRMGIKATPHNMRHTCATKLFRNPSLNPALICKSLGFSMQIAQKVYINFSDSDLALVAKEQNYEAK